jgi:hypothetical protein
MSAFFLYVYVFIIIEPIISWSTDSILEWTYENKIIKTTNNPNKAIASVSAKPNIA